MNGKSRLEGGSPTLARSAAIVDRPAHTEARARRHARETAVLRRWERDIEVERLRSILIEAAEDRRGSAYRRATADLDMIFIAGAFRRVRDREIVRRRRQSRVDGAA